jgi:hypothetical protein
VIGANGPQMKDSETGETVDNHYQFSNGVVHTIHVVGNGVNVFIPKEFSEVRVSSKGTVVATNPKTGEVLMIAHVKIGAGKTGLANLKNNMKTVRENGTVLIGETGGRGGEALPAVGAGKPSVAHSHIQYHPSNRAFSKAYRLKKAEGGLADFTQAKYDRLVSDFRRFVR